MTLTTLALFCSLSVADVQASWTDWLDEPYSQSSFTNHLTAIDEHPTKGFDKWYISGVYRAKRSRQAPLWVVQIYNGTPQSFNLGCLVIFDSKGRLLRTIPHERVHWSLVAPKAEFELDYKKTSNKIVSDLPDLNGDGFDEIPTQRWKQMRPGGQGLLYS